MIYTGAEVPIVNKNFSYNTNFENRVICSSQGQVKILYSDPKLFEEFLSCVDGNTSLEYIEDKFRGRYKKEEVEYFISILLTEKIIEFQENKTIEKKHPNVLIIGKNNFNNLMQNTKYLSIEDFLDNKDSYRYDYAVIADDNLSYSEIIRLNRKLYDLGKVYSQIRFNGENIVLGPLVIPGKSACLECGITVELKKINKKISDNDKLNLNNLSELKYSFEIPNSIPSSRVNYCFEVLIADIENFLCGKDSLLLDYQYEYNNKYIEFVKNECLPSTSCDYCHAFNNHYITYQPQIMTNDELLLTGSRKSNLNFETKDIKYNIGGLRSKSEVDTRKIVFSDFENLGAKVSVKPAIGNPFHDNGIVNCYNSNIEFSLNSSNDVLIRKNEGAGKGLTKEQSFFSAAFELIEHYSLQYEGNVPIICAKYKEIKDIAVDMHAFYRTIKNSETAFDDFDENNEIDWVVATSISDGSKILVPASLVFMYDVDLKGTFFGATSNGAAAGTTLEDAILHGILEAVERDAWIIGQSNPYILPIVDYSSIANQRVKNIIQHIKDLGYDIITRDYTNDIGIPVYRTWIVDKLNYSKYAYMGFGCHISPELAIERSITEAVQIDDWSETGGEVDADMIDLSVLSNSLINIYNQHYLVNKDIFGKTERTTRIEETNMQFFSVTDAIIKITDILKEKIGADIYYVDLSKDNLQTKVIRVIITGDFQLMNIPLISVTDRLFEFGQRCGYSNRKTLYEELFMGKYQH